MLQPLTATPQEQEDKDRAFLISSWIEFNLEWSTSVKLTEEREPFVTPDEAARFLGISPVTVKKMAREGDVPAHPIGNGIRKRWRFGQLPSGGTANRQS